MIRKNVWDEIKGKWPRFPSTGWDHWLRHGSGLRPRECIAPEVSRTHHFAEHGVNVNNGPEKARLESMVTASLPREQLGDLSYLLKDRYDADMRQRLSGAQHLEK